MSLLSSLRIIGMIHFPPLLGSPDHPGIETIESYMRADTKALEEGGVDAIMLENNYDLPHTRLLSNGSRQDMRNLCHTARSLTALPLGICCLWNDWKSALDIALECNLQFIRIPVFVDHIATHYNYEIEEDPEEITAYRSQIGG